MLHSCLPDAYILFQSLKIYSNGDSLKANLIGAAALLTLSLSGCSGAPQSSPTAPSVEPATASATPTATPTPTDAKSPRGNLIKMPGQAASVTDNDATVASFVVKSIKLDPKCTSPSAMKPKNGHFLVLDVAMETTPALAKSVNPEFGISSSYAWKAIAAHRPRRGRPQPGHVAEPAELVDDRRRPGGAARGFPARRRHRHLGHHRLLHHLGRGSAANGAARRQVRAAEALHAWHGTRYRVLRAGALLAELRVRLYRPRADGAGDGDGVPKRRRHGRHPGSAGRHDFNKAARPDPDGQHVRGRGGSGGGRAAGEPGRLAGAVPDQRAACAGRAAHRA
jgi:hypothetical protein